VALDDRADHVGIHAGQLQPGEARPTLCFGRCSLDLLPLLRPRMVGAVRPQRPPLSMDGAAARRASVTSTIIADPPRRSESGQAEARNEIRPRVDGGRVGREEERGDGQRNTGDDTDPSEAHQGAFAEVGNGWAIGADYMTIPLSWEMTLCSQADAVRPIAVRAAQ
jgi:hypothetical protein